VGKKESPAATQVVEKKLPPSATAPVAAVRPALAGAGAETLLRHLASAVAVCRQSRWALSLLLIEIDRFAELERGVGRAGADHWTRALQAICGSLDHPSKVCLETRPGQVALILGECQRAQGVELGNEVLRQWRNLHFPDRQSPVTVSLGAAAVVLPPRNFSAHHLLDSASRCLYAAQVAGNCLKSIEIY
jgi:GGDEF domain-containing protein